jgi:hypothetical protein
MAMHGVSCADGGEELRELGEALHGPRAAMQLAAEWLRVRAKSGRLVPLVANGAQRRFEERRGRENIVLKARQMGMSTWVAGRFLLRTILVPGTTTLMVAHTRESAEALFGTVVRMWENLPAEVQQLAGGRGRASASQMTFPGMDSEFRVASAGEANAGRGLTVHNLHCSEVARWPGDAAETLAGLRAAVAPGGEVVLESTPNGAYGGFYAEWMGAEERGVVRHFLPWWMEPSYVGTAVTDMTEEEKVLVAREGLSAEQVGFRRELQRRFGVMRTQEFAEDAVSCFRVSGSCFFEAGALGAGEAWIEEWRGGALRVWLPPVPGRRYVAAVDAAGGGSLGDYAAVQVVDEATGVQCAELQQRLGPRDLALVSAGIAREYNGALLVVERNNHGAAVLAYLEGEGGFRLYAGRDRMDGWLTDSASRPRMLSGLAVLVSQRPELFKSERLLAECRSFVVDGAGRAAAASGTHDDLVMSMAVAQSVASQQVSASASQRRG